jgi:hypothetical protein
VFVIPESLELDIITAVATLLTNYNGSWYVRLFTNAISPSPQTKLADFVEVSPAQVPNYAPSSTGSIYSAFYGVAGDAEMAYTSLLFQAQGNPPQPIDAIGWFATRDNPPTILMASGVFSAPFQFRKDQDAAVLQTNPMDMAIVFSPSQIRFTLPNWQPS